MRASKTIHPLKRSLAPRALGLAAAALFTVIAVPAHGQLITPVAATAQSYYADDDRAPGHAIDGSGMSPNAPVATNSSCGTGPGGAMWLSNGNQDTWITFDLGSVQTIAGFHLWNYNENSGSGEYQRGVQTAGIYAGASLPADGEPYAAAGANWGTLVQNMTFTMAPGSGAYTGEDYSFATPVTTRYLQIYVTSGFAGSDGYTGISEIRFIPAAAILSFGTNVAGSSAVIDQSAKTIDWTVPYGTNLAALAPTFTLSTGTCDPVSGTTRDFSSSVSYTVTDGGTTNTYTVYGIEGPASPACDITAFDAGLPGSSAVVTTSGPTTGSVIVQVPYGTTEGAVNLLAPTYTLSAGATCDQTNSTTPSPALSFTTPVTYSVTAQDGTTIKDYTVTVVARLEPPAGVTDLALWLDAAQLSWVADGATVHAWPDSSGTGNHAVRANGAPTYQTSVLNGQPVVRFYSDAAVGDYFGFPRINTIRTVFWVLKDDHTANRNQFLLGDSDTYQFYRGADNLWNPGGTDGNIMGGTTKLMGTVVDGTTTPLPRGSFQLVSLVTTGNVQANQLTQDRVWEGSWKGDIAEVLIYSRALTAQEESAVGKYLTTKYGLETSYAAAQILSFGTNVAGSSAVISPLVGGSATIAWTLPYDPYGKPGGAALIAALSPTYTLTSGTCVQPNDGFTPPAPGFGAGPVSYTVTDTSTVPATANVYTVTATVAPVSTACDITAFDAGAGTSAAISTTSPTTGSVVVYVPLGTTPAQVAALAPTYTLSAGATCDQTNSAIPSPPLSFTTPVHYLVTAEDGTTTKDYTVTVAYSGWSYAAWTGDANSGITNASPYTAAVNFTGGGGAVIVNGVFFEDSTASGANFAIGGDIGGAASGAPNVTGGSYTLANAFIFGGNPRTVTLTNLTPGATYETSLFSFGWEAAPNVRIQTFAAGGDALVLDQDFYGENNGIRIAYTFVADASGTKVLTITPADAGTTFHMSAMANRLVPPAGGYSAWQDANSATGQTLEEDHDDDGVPNGIEWFVMGPNNSTGFTALPGVAKDPETGALSVTWTKDGGYPGSYPADFVVETSATLTGEWTPETEAPSGNVTITGNEVTYTFPMPLGDKKFARLRVTGP